MNERLKFYQEVEDDVNRRLAGRNLPENFWEEVFKENEAKFKDFEKFLIQKCEFVEFLFDEKRLNKERIAEIREDSREIATLFLKLSGACYFEQLDSVSNLFSGLLPPEISKDIHESLGHSESLKLYLNSIEDYTSFIDICFVIR